MPRPGGEYDHTEGGEEGLIHHGARIARENVTA